MGYSHKHYQRIVKEVSESHEYNIQLVKHYRASAGLKKQTWLLLLGLTETWDIVRNGS